MIAGHELEIGAVTLDSSFLAPKFLEPSSRGKEHVQNNGQQDSNDNEQQYLPPETWKRFQYF